MRRHASGPAWISSSRVGGFDPDDWLAAIRAVSKTWSPRTTPRRSVRSVGNENVTYLMIRILVGRLNSIWSADVRVRRAGRDRGERIQCRAHGARSVRIFQRSLRPLRL